MVILFSDRKNRIEKEITEILTFAGADYISDKTIYSGEGFFSVISEYKKIDLKIKNGIAVFCGNADRFKTQVFPENIIGICEDTNTAALQLFKINRIPVISCGMNSKNTITLSSIIDNELLASLQRSIYDINGKKLEPAEFKIKLNKNYSPFSVMASLAVLLLKGIIPKEF